MSRVSKGLGMYTELDTMQEQLQRVLQKITIEANNHIKCSTFNPNSPRQVSEALFGIEGESTGKEVLEAIASSKSSKKHLADLILQFRQLSRDISKRKKRQVSKEKGSLVTSVHTVKRSQQTATSSPAATATATTGQQVEEVHQDQALSPKQTLSKATPNTVRDDPLLLVDASAYIFRA